MRKKGSRYAAIVCACAMVFSSVPVCAADDTPVDEVQNEEVQETNPEQESEEEEQTTEIKEENELQSAVDEQNAESTDMPRITGMSVDGIEDKDNIETPANFNITMDVENVEVSDKLLITMNYESDGEKYRYQELYASDSSSSRIQYSNEKLYFPIDVNKYEKPGNYKINQISIHSFDKQKDIEYVYDEENKCFSTNDSGSVYAFSYNGEADFTIIKSDYNKGIPVEISDLSIVGDKDNITSQSDIKVRMKVKNGLSKGIFNISVVYENAENGNRISGNVMFPGNWFPEEDGEYCEIPIDTQKITKTGKYRPVAIEIADARHEYAEVVEYTNSNGKWNTEYLKTGSKYEVGSYNGEIDLNVTEIQKKDSEAPYITSIKNADENNKTIYDGKYDAINMEVGYKEDISGISGVTVVLKNKDSEATISGTASYKDGEKEAGEGKAQIAIKTEGVEPGEYEVSSVTISDYAFDSSIGYYAYNSREYHLSDENENILIDNEGNQIDVSGLGNVKINKIQDNGLKLSNIRWSSETQAAQLHIGDQAKGFMTLRNDSQKDIIIDPKTCMIWWGSGTNAVDSYASGEGNVFVLKSGYEKDIPFTLSVTKEIIGHGEHFPVQIILNSQNESASTSYKMIPSISDYTKRMYIRKNEPTGVEVEQEEFEWDINYEIVNQEENDNEQIRDVNQLSIEKGQVTESEKAKIKIEMPKTQKTEITTMSITLVNKLNKQSITTSMYCQKDFTYSEKEHSYIVEIPVKQMTAGEYYVETLWMAAKNGNSAYYRVDQNDMMNNDTYSSKPFKTVSFTVTNSKSSTSDYVAPVLESVELVGSNKVTSPGEVTYRIKASDANKLSEIRLFYLYNKGINAMTIKSSSIKEESEGTYLCTFKIEEYHETGDYQLYTIGLIDGSAYKNDRAYKYNEETGEFESQDMASIKVSGNLALTKEGNEVIASGEKNLEDEVKKASEGTTIVVADLQKELIISTETLAEIKDKKLTLVVSDDDRTSKLIINGNDLAKVPNKDLKVTVERGMMTEEEIQVGTEKDEIYYPVNVTTTDASVPVTLRVKLDEAFLKQVSQKNICLSRRNADGTIEVIKEKVSVTEDGYVEYTFAGGLSEQKEIKQSLSTELDKLYSAVTLASDLSGTVEEYEFIISAPKKEKSDVVLGDINQDGSINIQDLMLCLNHVSQKSLLTGEALTAADVDESGAVDIRDLMRLLNYVSGKSATL